MGKFQSDGRRRRVNALIAMSTTRPLPCPTCDFEIVNIDVLTASTSLVSAYAICADESFLERPHNGVRYGRTTRRSSVTVSHAHTIDVAALAPRGNHHWALCRRPRQLLEAAKKIWHDGFGTGRARGREIFFKKPKTCTPVHVER